MNLILSLVLSLVCYNALSQCPANRWSMSGGSNDTDVGHSVISDGIGNIYVAGIFGGSMNLNGYAASSNADEQMFLAKVNCSAQVEWIQTGARAAGHGRSATITIQLDSKGDIVMAGTYSYMLAIGDTILDSSPIAWDQLFIAKFTNGGNLKWAKTIGPIETGSIIGEKELQMTLDKRDNIYVAGRFDEYGTHIGSITLNGCSSCYDGFFIAKLDENANAIWVKEGAFSGQGHVAAIATDDSGNLYLTGYGTYGIEFPDLNLTLEYGNTFFLIKTDSSGNSVWSRTSSDISAEGSDIVFDQAGNFYVGGIYESFSTTATISGIPFYDKTGFLLKYDVDGNILWHKDMMAEVMAMAIDRNENLHVVGNSGMLEIDSQQFYYAGNRFIAKIDSSGNLIYLSPCGNGADYFDMVVDLDHPYITGTYFQGAVIGDSIVSDSVLGVKIIGDTLSRPLNGAYQNLFIAKLSNRFQYTGITPAEFYQSSLNYYPNPCTDYLTISSQNTADEILGIEITSVSGKKVYTWTATGEYLLNKRISVSNYPPGLYLMRVKVVNGCYSEKILIYK